MFFASIANIIFYVEFISQNPFKILALLLTALGPLALLIQGPVPLVRNTRAPMAAIVVVAYIPLAHGADMQ
jgi:hypothetical protein